MPIEILKFDPYSPDRNSRGGVNFRNFDFSTHLNLLCPHPQFMIFQTFSNPNY